MNRTICMKTATRLALGLAVLALAAMPSFAVELAAVNAEWLPPGGTAGSDEIPMWSFVEIAAPDTAAAYSCPGAPVAWDVPVLTAPEGTLNINIKNCLGVEVSVFIPGLAKDAANALAPQTTLDGSGRERLTSLDMPIAATATGTYSWSATEGTYLFHSGTDLRTQVPMGLYGALVVTGTAYPTVVDQVLVFSEIDPALNADPAGFGGARVSNWNPQYFLINGQAFDAANPPIAIDVSTDVLLRFVNAGLETFVPTLGGGLYMDVIAEDGNLYPYPLTQYGLELQAGKTYDAVINAGAAGTYALYDRSLHAGMQVNIAASPAAGAPSAIDDPTVAGDYDIVEDSGSLTATAGGLTPGVLDNDIDGAAAAVLVSGPSFGVLTGGLAADGSFTYTPNADFSGVDTFTYVTNDGLGGPDSNVATATITVTPVNDAPVAVADGYDAAEGMTLSVAAPGVLENDTDVDGDALTASPVGTPPLGALTLNADGSFDYTPAGTAGAVETFDYEACDAELLCSTATVTITVAAPPANVPPTANDDTTEVTRGTTLSNYDIIANDTDSDGTIDATSVVITTGVTTQAGGTVVNNGDGTITYTPKNTGYRGTDAFQYTVDDNDGATSDPATVRINVVK